MGRQERKALPFASTVSLDESGTIVKPTNIDKQYYNQQLTTSSQVRRIPPIEQNG